MFKQLKRAWIAYWHPKLTPMTQDEIMEQAADNVAKAWLIVGNSLRSAMGMPPMKAKAKKKND